MPTVHKVAGIRLCAVRRIFRNHVRVSTVAALRDDCTRWIVADSYGTGGGRRVAEDGST